jgi:phage shock protein A
LQKVSAVSQDLQKSLKQLSTEIDSIKVKMAGLSTKKEVEELVEKFENFEKHVNNVISTLNSRISTFDQDFSYKFQEKIEKADKLVKGFEMLAAKTPDLDKYFNLLEEEAKKAPSEAKIEKIKALGEGENVKETKKEGFFSKLKKKFKKSEGSELEEA